MLMPKFYKGVYRKRRDTGSRWRVLEKAVWVPGSKPSEMMVKSDVASVRSDMDSVKDVAGRSLNGTGT